MNTIFFFNHFKYWNFNLFTAIPCCLSHA